LNVETTARAEIEILDKGTGRTGSRHILLAQGEEKKLPDGGSRKKGVRGSDA